MPTSPRTTFSELLTRLTSKSHLSPQQMTALMEEVLAGRLDDSEVAAVLTALRMKGETAHEIAAAARVLRTRMTTLSTGRNGVLDTCGMGGDGCATFNISTATAFVAAGAGVPVVKHGNRGVSSRSGSADVLEVLGISARLDRSTARRCLDEAGCVFCFAPHYHPAMARFAELRRRLGVRTLFNLLGPLLNPAGAEFQLLGVASPELLDPLAGALAMLGTQQSILVCGSDGLDEVTLAAQTYVRLVRGHSIESTTWSAPDFGLEPCALDDLRVDGPEASAACIRSVLGGQEGPALRMVLANAAAALLAARHVSSLKEGVESARESIVSGKARDVLERLCKLSLGAQSIQHGES
jgi:anthranilate phosphoribosyltransferase